MKIPTGPGQRFRAGIRRWTEAGKGTFEVLSFGADQHVYRLVDTPWLYRAEELVDIEPAPPRRRGRHEA